MASKTTYLAQFHENQCFFPDGKNVSQMIIFVWNGFNSMHDIPKVPDNFQALMLDFT